MAIVAEKYKQQNFGIYVDSTGSVGGSPGIAYAYSNDARNSIESEFNNKIYVDSSYAIWGTGDLKGTVYGNGSKVIDAVDLEWAPYSTYEKQLRTSGDVVNAIRNNEVKYITVQTSSETNKNIDITAFLTWMVKQGHIPCNITCHRIFRTSWSYAGNDNLCINDNDTTKEYIGLEGSTIEFTGYIYYSGSDNINLTTHNSHNFEIKFICAPTVSGTSYPRSIWVYRNNGKDFQGGFDRIIGKQYNYSSTQTGEIFNDYNSNVASGVKSHAEGGSTKALGNYSHAEGNGTTASGLASHTEGTYTVASNVASHAEGSSFDGSNNISASGQGSHAGGFINKSATDKGTTTIVASGNGSHASGFLYNSTNTTNEFKSSGQGATAFGYVINGDMRASGNGSFVSGYIWGSYMEATGHGAHAEGVALGSAIHANGLGSHAEGINTTSTGTASHAEGGSTTASASYTHAEGKSTQASGACSHAEGGSTKALGNYSHAEGNGTEATSNSNSGAHVEGYQTKATATGHAEGYSATKGNILVSNTGAHAEGYAPSEKTITASGYGAHAEGYAKDTNITASGHGSHAEGDGTNSSGWASHAEGRGSVASGSYTHAEGNYTSAIGNDSHSEGQATCANGYRSHAEGVYSYTSGDGAHAEGYITIAAGHGSHSEGMCGSLIVYSAYSTNSTTIVIKRANNWAAVRVGMYIVTWKHWSKITAISKSDTTCTLTLAWALGNALAADATIYLANTSLGASSHTEGSMTLASGGHSHAEGYASMASGTESHAEGSWTTASGNHSHTEGHSNTASGNYSHAEGQSNTASGQYAHVEGYDSLASGLASHAEGKSNTASGIYSHSGGCSSTSSQAYSFVHGCQLSVSNTYEVAFGKYNKTNTGQIFSIGNGTSTSRSNVFEVYSNGYVKAEKGAIFTYASQYYDTKENGALNLQNSDIYNVNSIKFADKCEDATEGLQWYRDSTHADSMWVKDGVPYFTPNRTWGSTSASNYTMWHSGNDGSGSGLDADLLDGRHWTYFVYDYGASITTNIYNVPCKSVFSGQSANVSDKDSRWGSWFSGITLGSNWNNSHYQHYIVESNDALYHTRQNSDSKMINWRKVLDDKNALKTMSQRYTIDASNTTTYNVDKWYPVTIPLDDQKPYRNYRIEMECTLDYGSSDTKPTWANHNNGFTSRKIWESNGSGWGTSTVTRNIWVSDYNWVKSGEPDPIRGVGQLTNSGTEYVYVRGGGKYNISVSDGCGEPTLRSADYTIKSQTAAVLSSPPDEIKPTFIGTSNNADKVDNYHVVVENGTHTGSSNDTLYFVTGGEASGNFLPLDTGTSITNYPYVIANAQTYFQTHIKIAGNVYATSDIRVKNVLNPWTINIEQLASLPIFNYTWKNKDDNNIHIGTSAQAVEEIIPELVSDNGEKSLDYSTLGTIVGIMSAREIVKLKEENKQLKSEIELLKNQLSEIKDMISKIQK